MVCLILCLLVSQQRSSLWKMADHQMLPAVLQAQPPFFFYQKQSSGLHLIKKRKRKAHPTSYETESLSKVGITGGRGKLTPLILLYKFTYTMKLYKDGYMNTLRSQQTSSSLGFQNNHLIERWRCQDLSFVFCLTAPASSTL